MRLRKLKSIHVDELAKLKKDYALDLRALKEDTIPMPKHYIRI